MAAARTVSLQAFGGAVDGQVSEMRRFLPGWRPPLQVRGVVRAGEAAKRGGSHSPKATVDRSASAACRESRRVCWTTMGTSDSNTEA
jgi:hypothetical protein